MVWEKERKIRKKRIRDDKNCGFNWIFAGLRRFLSAILKADRPSFGVKHMGLIYRKMLDFFNHCFERWSVKERAKYILIENIQTSN